MPRCTGCAGCSMGVAIRSTSRGASSRMASEDIGNADPRGLQIALAAWDAYLRLGSPEGEFAIAQAVLYLACVPKSNAVYTAFSAASADVASGAFVRRAATLSQRADAADEGTWPWRGLPLRTRRSRRVRGRRKLLPRRDAARGLLPPRAARARAAHRGTSETPQSRRTIAETKRLTDCDGRAMGSSVSESVQRLARGCAGGSALR